jgi:hypothetical protein
MSEGFLSRPAASPRLRSHRGREFQPFLLKTRINKLFLFDKIAAGELPKEILIVLDHGPQGEAFFGAPSVFFPQLG